MTWVRFDDQFPIHRKVAPLDDATYRLCSEAVFWAARNTTDGRIAADELPTVSLRASKARARKLVDRGIWHEADQRCDSPKCPKPGVDGWVIHDYLEYQFSKERVRADQEAKAERTRKWRERKATGSSRDVTSDASQDASSDSSSDASPSPSPPRPEGKRGGAPRSDPDRQRAGGAVGIEEPNPAVAMPCDRCGNGVESAYHQRVCIPSEAKGAA